MKIMLVGPSSEEGGMSRYVNDILENDTNSRVTLFNTVHPTKSIVRSFGSNYYSQLFDSGVNRALRGLFLSGMNLWKYPFALRKSQVDIVHVCGVSFNPFWERGIYLIISKMMGKKIFMHYLGSFDQFYHSSSSFSRFLIRNIMLQTDKIAVLSNKAKRAMLPFVKKEKIVLIPSSVNVQNKTKEYNFSKGDEKSIYILSLAGSHPYRKGVLDIVKTIPSAVVKNNNIIFVFAGNETVKKILSRISKPIRENNIEYIGRFDEEDKWNLYKSVDVLLLPSYNEGLPYVIVEALASGLPIIASNIGGIPEVVENGVNGFIIEPGDYKLLEKHITTLASNSAYRKEISRRNKVKAQRSHSLSINLGKIDLLYKELIN